MKKQNLAFIDTETTGLDFLTHEIIEIGVVLVAQEKLPSGAQEYTVLEEFELKIKPERIADADPVALRVNQYDPSEWVFAYTLPEAMQIFSKKTAGAIMVAHNVVFDFIFLEKAFRDTHVPNLLHYHKLDTISIAFAKLHAKDDISRYSLAALCEEFKIENKRAHTALADARATFELYQKLMTL